MILFYFFIIVNCILFVFIIIDIGIFINVMCFIWIFCIFKLICYFSSFKVIGYIIRVSVKELFLLFFVFIIGVLIFGVLIYFVE